MSHPGISVPSLPETVWHWTPDPVVIGALALSAVLYTAGTLRMRHGMSPWRAAAHGAGLVVLAAALLSPLDGASDVLFSAHMAQHEPLMLVAAPLIVLGRPLVPLLWLLPEPQRQRLMRASRPRAVWRVLTHPAVALALHAIARWIWHVPVLFDAALGDERIHAVQHLSMFATAALFWWTLIHGRYGRASYGVAVLFVFVTVLHSGLLAALLSLADHPLYAHGERTIRWGLDAVADQQRAGLVMWVPAGVIMMGTGLALFTAWLGRLERTLVIALVVLLASRAARADEASGGEVIVITGLRLPRAVIDTPAATRVLERRDLAHAPAALADDLLRAVPQVGTFRRSSSWVADPTSQGLNLRGVGPSGVSRALVLRDGIPENDPFGGWIYWRAISPLALDRIEITPSGASALFGDFALGGVVQLVSRPIEKRGVSALLSGGSYGTAHGALRATERRGGLGLALDADAARSGGYAPIAPAQRGAADGRAGSAHAALAARIEQRVGDSTIHATGRYFRESLDAGTAHTTADVQAVALATGWTTSEIDVELFGGVQRFDQERARVSADRSTAATASEQRTPSNNQGGLVTWASSVGTRHALVLGGDVQRIAGRATDHLSPPMVGDMTVVERSAGGEQRFAGLFAQDAWRVTPRVELTGALRLDAWQNVDGERAILRGSGEREVTPLAETSDVQLDPRVGVLAHVSDALALRASAYRAFRAPTLNELYRPFQVGTVLTAANDRLRAETLWGAEAGPQIAIDTIVVRATGFYNRLEDPITNVTLDAPDASGAMRRRDNLGRARIFGLELDASWHPMAAWTFGIAHLFSDATVTRAPGAPMLVGNRLAQDPRHRTTADVTFDDPRLLTATVQVRYLGTQFEDDLNTLPIGSAILVDVRVARRIARGFSAFAAVTNLGDARYLVGRAGIDTLGAPRMIEAGVVLE